MKSFLFLFLLLFEADLMDLHHRVLILLIVFGRDGPGRADQLNNFSEFVHFGPVGGVKSVCVSKIDVSSIGHNQLYNVSIPVPGCVVKSSETSFIADGGVGSVVQKKMGDLVVVFFDRVVEGSLLANIVVLFEIGVGSVLQHNFYKVYVLDDDCRVKRSASVDISRVDLGLFV